MKNLYLFLILIGLVLTTSCSTKPQLEGPPKLMALMQDIAAKGEFTHVKIYLFGDPNHQRKINQAYTIEAHLIYDKAIPHDVKKLPDHWASMISDYNEFTRKYNHLKLHITDNGSSELKKHPLNKNGQITSATSTYTYTKKELAEIISMSSL